MKVEIRTEGAQDIRLTLTCTMTLAQWERLSDLLKDQPYHSDASSFHRAISEAVGHATEHFQGGVLFQERE